MMPLPHRAVAALLPLLLAAACARPAPEAYVAGVTRAAAGEPAGVDARGEACLMGRGAALPADLPVLLGREVFCGGWTQPAARIVQLRGPTDAAQLDALAVGGQWRTWLDQRVTCGTPQPTTLANGAAARLLSCTRRAGGWPHVALVAAGRDGPVVADGVAAAAPVMERLAMGQTAAADATVARSAGLELLARTLSAQAFGASDIGRFEQLMLLGRELNQAENYAAAEEAYRAALALQERLLGAGDPNTANALVHLALNLSNQSRQQEADALFARATTLAPRAADPVLPARLAHYRGLASLNVREDAAALDLLRTAEAQYVTLIPASMLSTGTEADIIPLVDPTARSAVLGLAEARRGMALTLARLGRPDEVGPMIADGRRLLRRGGREPGLLLARSLRLEAMSDSNPARTEASARQLEAAARRFNTAAPGERPEAVTLFLSGARRAAAGRRAEALSAFRSGAAILRARQITLPVDAVLPYLDALNDEAAARPAEEATLRAEMFAVAQLAQRSNTTRFVQQASARIGAAAGDRRVAEAVRRLQDSDTTLRGLYADRDSGGAGDLDARIVAAQNARAEAESEVAAAAPGYRQLLLSSVDASAVAAVLAPGEAVATMLIGRDHGWVLLIRAGRVHTLRTTLTEAEATRLIGDLRAGTVTAAGTPGRFDPAPAQALYDALLRPLEGPLEGADTLIVVPDGPLLAQPFGMLLTGTADTGALGAAPWLIKRHAIVHVPSPQTLVTLRGAGTGSTAPRAYVGFGDFVPPTAAQLLRTFPVDRCAADARLAQGLGRLPGTRAEVQLAQNLTGARPEDVRLGAAFTPASLRSPDLGTARILHLATHALLPGELSCLPEPSIVVSTPAGSADAAASFVKASDLLGLKLDADLVVLSACNTGGPGGAGGGEALSGLARAFFYAGARGLLVTHWAVDDAAAALTVADSIRRQQGGASSATALRGAQLVILEEAGRRLPPDFAHPFYWAPFALIGDGRRDAAPVRTAAAAAGG